MSITQIKLSFLNYLTDHKLLTKDKLKEAQRSGEDIFAQNFEYFKDYLLEQLTQDPDSFNKDFSIIENMDFGEADDEESLKTQLTEKLLEVMYSDPDVIALLDTDGDGKLSAEEKEQFEAFVKGDAENLTVEDLQGAYEKIKSGTFEFNPSNTQNQFEPPKTTNDNNIFSTGSSDSTTPSGSDDTSSSTPPPDTTSSTPPAATEEKDYSKLSKSELQTELSSAQGELTTAQSNYQNIMSGSDSEISGLKENANTLYQTYLSMVKEVDETMAGELDSAVQAVNTKESELDAKSQEVSTNKIALSNAKTAHDSAKNSVTSLTASLNSLNGTNTANLTDEQKTQLENKKSQVSSDLAKAQEAEAAAKLEEEKAQEALTKSEEEETTLKTELDELKTNKADIEAKIAAAHPEVAKAQSDYDTAQAKYESTKSEKASAASEAVTAAQEKISKIEAAISAADIKETEKANEFKPEGEYPTAEELNITAQYIPRGQDSDLPYLLIGPQNPVEGKEYPVLVFCPGAAQYDKGQSAMYLNTTPGGVMFDYNKGTGESTYNWDLNGFDGYIIVPQLRNGQHWTSDWTANQVKGILDNLEPNHNITRGKTVIAGASMGVSGVSGIGSRLGTEYFDEAVFISENPNTKGFGDMPVTGYYAASGEGWVRRAMNKAIGAENTNEVAPLYDENGKMIEKSTHNTVVDVLFNHDDDKNGFSDFLEKFFPEYYHK